ncbi:MAG: hypothetical protein IH599_04685, partial [Bacteroidales bacterium]|nr:hypothetical protein [Bacteroidales bacterium]
FTAGAALALKQGNALFGAGIIRSGDGESALTRMAMSVGLALHERLRAGSGVSMMINRWAAELPPALSPGLTLSLMYEADHRLSLQMMSALRLPLTNDPYRPRYMMCLLSGARYAVAESFVLRFELERLSSGRLGIRGGLEANAGKHHSIYAGADPGTQRFSIGWAWRIGRSVVGFATEHHPLLGNSPWLAWEQGIGRHE